MHHLDASPRLAQAEVPGGFSHEQLEQLARSVEARRQQLEDDIAAYIVRKQDELRRYEAELVEQHRAMLGGDDDNDRDASRRSSTASHDAEKQHDDEKKQHEKQPDEKKQHDEKKQKKHGRVHKREKELYGLVTPVFLPLLDARESTSPTKKATTAAAAAASNAEPATAAAARSPQHESRAMAPETPTKERAASEPARDAKKSRRSSIKKKSALRHSSAPRNRKRVSLVIDDQVVRPSDTISEPPLTSPSSETTSATTSTASLDDMIDPRLTASDAPVYIEHHDAVHHSLPLAMAHPKTSPVKPLVQPLSNPSPDAAAPLSSTDAFHSPPTSPAIRSPTSPAIRSPTSPALRSPTTAFAPPSYATRSFLDPPPERMPMEDLPMPPAAGPDAIFPDENNPEDQLASLAAAANDDQNENFSTYVGGLSGSGVDDVNQVGSVGYPSSLGASYLESYMQTRPLSVRMAAAERAGDAAEMSRLRALEERQKKKEHDAQREKERLDEDEWGMHVDADAARGDDDDFMGSMDDF